MVGARSLGRRLNSLSNILFPPLGEAAIALQMRIPMSDTPSKSSQHPSGRIHDA